MAHLLRILLIIGLASSSCGKRFSRHHKAREETKPFVATVENSLPTEESKHKGVSTRNNVCDGWWCGHGKECRSGDQGLPECICVQTCPKGVNSKHVCGSDGRKYSSHCELHRTACLSNSLLTVDSTTMLCFEDAPSTTTTVFNQNNQINEHSKPSKSFASNIGSVKGEKQQKKQRQQQQQQSRNSDKAAVPRLDYNGKISQSQKAQILKTSGSHKSGGDGASNAGIAEKVSRGGWILEPSPKSELGLSSTDFQNSFESEDLDLDLDDEDADMDEDEDEDADEQQQQQDEMVEKSKSDENSQSHSQSHSSKEKEIKRDSSSSPCSPQEYEILKDNLLLYSHERMIGGVQNFKKAMEGDNGHKNVGSQQNQQPSPDKFYVDEALEDGLEAGKDYLLSLMFSHFDRNNNGQLEYEELHKIGLEPHMKKLANGCNLPDLLRYDDVDRNSQLNINEFYTAFNKLYSVSVISLDKALEVTHVIANVGENIELKCDVSGTPPTTIVWKRYNLDLSTLNQESNQIRVFSDGTLLLNKIQLLFAGNYTCQAQRNDKVVQTHILSVQTLPDVKVTPHIVWETPGQEVTMECRVTGEPFPVVQWLKNDDPLPPEMSDKYIITGDAIRLTLKDIYFSDTGAFMCQAQNSAGKRLDIASLVVIDDQTPSTVQTNESQFFVFHELGISIYDPANCRIQHQIQSTDIIPGTQEYVCGEHSQACDWGRAVKVASTYVYVSQPKMDRILVISVSQMVVVDVVSTDRFPVELDYVPHLDQIWVQCWRQQEPTSQKTLQVIRDAKEKKKHHTVHPEPIDSHFDLVENIFIPPDLKSSSQFRYAYVSHKNTRGLYKMDLIGLRYTKSVDLTPYNCFPQLVQFSALYGMTIVECFEPVTKRPTGQLVLDSLTDSVVYFKGDRYGKPYLSPDSRKLVTVTKNTDGTTLLLQLVKENGLEFFFDVKTSLNLSDISFFPSQRSHTYDLYASAMDKEDVLFVDLESGKVEMVSGVGGVIHASPWKSAVRPISSQGLFSKYLATPSSDAVFVLNGQTHTVNCQIGGLSKPHLIVWL